MSRTLKFKKLNINVDPFLLEELRDYYAKEKRKTDFLGLYKSNLPSLEDYNTTEFWNQKLESNHEKTESSAERNNIIVELIKNRKRKGGKYLGIGFGNLELERKLKDDFEIYGFDISKYAVEKAESEKIGVFKVGNINKIPFKEKFDVIVASEVFEHLPAHKIIKIYKQVWNSLNKNGILVLSVPLNENLKKFIKNGSNPNGHLRVYTKETLIYELELNGFKITESKELVAFSRMYEFKKFISKYLFLKKWEYNNLILVAKKV